MPLSKVTPFDVDPESLKTIEDVFEEYNFGLEKADIGKIISARFLSASGRELYFDIGEKEEGICNSDEFETLPNVGESISLLVKKRKKDGVAILSRKEASRQKAWNDIKEGFAARLNFNAKVSKILKSGYLLAYNDLELFLPFSHSGLRFDTKQKHELGKEIDFRVIELKERYLSAIVSHRLIIEEKNKVLWDEFEKKNKVGDIVEGVVIRRLSFGIFLEVDGLLALLHVKDMFWKTGIPFKYKFNLKTKLKVKLLSIDRANNRINLGLKQLEANLWDWVKDNLHIGEKIKGRIRSVMEYGAFMEIHSGLEGLIHISEMTWDHKKRHPKEYVKSKQEVEVYVISIDHEAERISLSLKQAMPSPWETIDEKVKVGDILEGEVLKVTDFASFVSVCDGIDGLIACKDYSWENTSKKDFYKKGQKIKFKILEINNDKKRLLCGTKQLTVKPHENFLKQNLPGSVVSGTINTIAPFGITLRLQHNIEGTVPFMELGLKSGEKLEEVYKIGNVVECVLQEIDTNKNRIYLSVKAYQDMKE